MKCMLLLSNKKNVLNVSNCPCSSSGRHRDEEVLEMRAQKKYQQLNRLLERQSRRNSSLSAVVATLTEDISSYSLNFTDVTDNFTVDEVNNNTFDVEDYPEPPYTNAAYMNVTSDGYDVTSASGNVTYNISGDVASGDDGVTVQQVPLYTSKHEHLEEVCKSSELQAPCQPLKKWRCEHDGFRCCYRRLIKYFVYY